MNYILPSKKILYYIGIFLTIAIAFYLVIQHTRYTFETNTYALYSERVPKAFEGYKIVHLTDLHSKVFGTENDTLLASIRGLSPDIILFTGDLVQSPTNNIEPALNFIKKCSAIAPTFYVTGNHERDGKPLTDLLSQISANGARILDNTSIRIVRNGESINLVGISDPKTIFDTTLAKSITQEELKKTLPTKPSLYTVLLAHRPELFDEYVGAGADLTVTGHTHGGQIRIPFVGALFVPGQWFFPHFDAGWFASGTARMYVNKGLGESIVPVRLNCSPEIARITLHHKDS